jgi:hypothetical protein
MKFITPLCIASALIACSSTPSDAQWSMDSTMHLVAADGDGEQVQPKISPTADGGCYLSWYSSVSGYDVRLQRLDAQGNELWTHNGILVADRGFSSTQDYDLATDLEGHAVLVFRDDRFSGTRITAQRVSPAGSAQWGVDGIQFANGSDFVASPDIATTTDGCTVIAWINNNDTHLAKIDQLGNTLWTTVLTDPGGDAINVASMHGSDNGSVIISWVQSATFFAPKRIYAQKINASGNEEWASRVAVFDGGSLQFGNFPEFTPESTGGATFSWYDTANSLQVYCQRLASDGTELFVHNGVPVSTAPRERVSPTSGYDPQTDSAYVAWVELDNNQGSQGVYVQRLDASGNRLWSDSGAIASPIDARSSGSVNLQVDGGSGGTVIAMWIENNGNFGQDQILAHGLTQSGADAWKSGTVEIASDLAERSRLTSAVSTDEYIITGWQSGGFGDADIEMHNLNYDGSLGLAMSCSADLNDDGELNFFDVSAFLAGFAIEDPATDFNDDGQFNFFDVSGFLSEYNAGCP